MPNLIRAVINSLTASILMAKVRTVNDQLTAL